LPNDKINKTKPTKELERYYALVIATIEFYILNQKDFGITAPEHYYESLRIDAEDLFNKGKVAKLKQWFRDLTEPLNEPVNFRFNKFIKEKTGYEVDIFKFSYKRIEKIISNGKITTDNQFYDVANMIDFLSENADFPKEKIKELDRMLFDYKKKKNKNAK
jgi:hypothetical protein